MDEATIVNSLLRALTDEQGAPVAIPYVHAASNLPDTRTRFPTLTFRTRRYASLRAWTDDFAAARRIGGGGFGEVFVGVAAIPAGDRSAGPAAGAALVDAAGQPVASTSFLGLAVKRLAPVRLQGQELIEWKQDALV
jgi:hypothetical protein